MNRGLEKIPERWRPRLRNFLIYILPVIVGEIVMGMARGDMAILQEMLPALAIWGLTGRIQAVPITWVVLLIGEPTLVRLDGVRGAIWILTAIGAGTGMVRIGQQQLLSKKANPKKNRSPHPGANPARRRSGQSGPKSPSAGSRCASHWQ